MAQDEFGNAANSRSDIEETFSSLDVELTGLADEGGYRGNISGLVEKLLDEENMDICNRLLTMLNDTANKLLSIEENATNLSDDELTALDHDAFFLSELLQDTSDTQHALQDIPDDSQQLDLFQTPNPAATH